MVYFHILGIQELASFFARYHFTILWLHASQQHKGTRVHWCKRYGLYSSNRFLSSHCFDQSVQELILRGSDHAWDQADAALSKHMDEYIKGPPGSEYATINSGGVARIIDFKLIQAEIWPLLCLATTSAWASAQGRSFVHVRRIWPDDARCIWSGVCPRICHRRTLEQASCQQVALRHQPTWTGTSRRWSLAGTYDLLVSFIYIYIIVYTIILI